MAFDCQEDLLVALCAGCELQKGYLWARLNRLFAFSSEMQSAVSFQINSYIFYQLLVTGEKLSPRSDSRLSDIWYTTITSPFHFLIKFSSQKQTNNNSSCISDSERMIYKNFPDCISFHHFCKQVWRLIRATLISRNYASSSWMYLSWLRDGSSADHLH